MIELVTSADDSTSSFTCRSSFAEFPSFDCTVGNDRVEASSIGETSNTSQMAEDVESVAEVLPCSERKSDADFLCELQRVTSLDDVIHADTCSDSSTWLKLVHGQIVREPTPTLTSSRRRRRHVDASSPYRKSSDENSVHGVVPVRRGRRSLFMTSTPLRDVANNHTPLYRRCASDTTATTSTSTGADCTGPAPALTKCQSMSTAVLCAAPDHDDDRLVGDFSRALCLPAVSAGAKHCDLNNISHHTMAKLLRNEFSDVVEKYTIVDCRYPYEYSGGHILGAKNLYSKDAILAEFLRPEAERPSQQAAGNDKRNIVIFHCEFSSERAPKLLRFLRNKDRDLHREVYPTLRHPELYLLHGGYCEFYGAGYGELCRPNGYQPMSDRRFASQLTRCRAESRLYVPERCTSSRRHHLHPTTTTNTTSAAAATPLHTSHACHRMFV